MTLLLVLQILLPLLILALLVAASRVLDLFGIHRLLVKLVKLGPLPVLAMLFYVILGTLYGAELITKDNELYRFAAERHARSVAHEDPFVHLSFSKAEVGTRRPSRESKEYINRGWRAGFHHYT